MKAAGAALLGTSLGGLPIGLQIVAPLWQDHLEVRTAQIQADIAGLLLMPTVRHSQFYAPTLTCTRLQ